MDKAVWLTAMPRSGSTWVSQFFASSPDVRVKFCPLYSYAFKGAVSELDGAERWQEFLSEVYRTPDEYMDQGHLRSKDLIPDPGQQGASPSTLLIKSNRFHDLTEVILEKLPRVRFIALVRHPLAMLHSWMTNPTEFPAGADPLEQWRTGACRKSGPGEFWGFDDWKKVTTAHLRLAREHPDRFRIYRYEEVARSPFEAARSMFSWSGAPYSDAVDAFIEKSRTFTHPHPRSVFRAQSRADLWNTGLDARIIGAVEDELKGTELAQFLEQP